jgi:hypothetical protein
LSPDRWLKYGLQVMAQGFNSGFHVSFRGRLACTQDRLTCQPVNATWLSLNCRTPQERSIAMAMCKQCRGWSGVVSDKQSSWLPTREVWWAPNSCEVMMPLCTSGVSKSAFASFRSL